MHSTARTSGVQHHNHVCTFLIMSTIAVFSILMYGCIHQGTTTQIESEEVQLREIGKSDSNRRNFFILKTRIANSYTGIIRTIQMMSKAGHHIKFIELPIDYVDFIVDSTMTAPSISCTYILRNFQSLDLNDENDFDALFKPSFTLFFNGNDYELNKVTTSGIEYVKYTIRCPTDAIPYDMDPINVGEENLQNGMMYY